MRIGYDRACRAHSKPTSSTRFPTEKMRTGPAGVCHKRAMSALASAERHRTVVTDRSLASVRRIPAAAAVTRHREPRV